MKASVTNRAFVPTDGTFANDPTTYLERVFVYFLQNLYRDFPEGCGMKWRPEIENTEMVISSEKPTLAAIDKTPHITVIHGSMQWGNLSLDQLQALQAIPDGERTHTDLMAQTVAYHCQAKSGVVARRIAFNASLYTNVLRRVLHRAGGLHHVAPNHTISAETAPTAFTGPSTDSKAVSVVVTVPFYWQVQWRITDPSTLWRRVRVELTVLKGGHYRSGSWSAELRAPRVNGRVVTTSPLDQPRETAFQQTVLETSLAGEE